MDAHQLSIRTSRPKAHRATTAQLTERFNQLINNRLTQSTSLNYARIVMRYQTFCRSHNLPPFPASLQSVCLWIADLSRRCSAASVANYLSAIGDHDRMLGNDFNAIRDHALVRAGLAGLHWPMQHRAVVRFPSHLFISTPLEPN